MGITGDTHTDSLLGEEVFEIVHKPKYDALDPLLSDMSKGQLQLVLRLLRTANIVNDKDLQNAIALANAVTC